jgi:hypothetical protein
VDPFVIVIGGLVGLLLLGVVSLGLLYPGSGADVLDWKTPRAHAETEAALESDDVSQMLEGVNARRRARGERELTMSDVEGGALDPADLT